MDELTQRTVNHAAYQRLKDTLAPTFGAGRFVAISEGQILADADNFAQLRDRLTALGKEPSLALIVQTGVTYPEEAVIFSVGGP